MKETLVFLIFFLFCISSAKGQIMKVYTSSGITEIPVISIDSIVFCQDSQEDYATKKEREKNAINLFIAKGCTIMQNDDNLVSIDPITVIDEETFVAHSYTTNVENNEYVLTKEGVYLQLVRTGNGEKLQEGQTIKVMCRFIEYNLLEETILQNISSSYATLPDICVATKRNGEIIGMFQSGIISSTYNTTAMPAGWLIPLRYINLGRHAENEDIAKIRIIVPHIAGHAYAQTNVIPYFYEITFEKGN